MCALGERVNACIRPSGAVHSDRHAAYLLKSTLEMILNRIAVGLALPAAKPRTIVRNNEFEPARHNGLSTSAVLLVLPAV